MATGPCASLYWFFRWMGLPPMWSMMMIVSLSDTCVLSYYVFLSDPSLLVRSMCLVSGSHLRCWNFTDVTLADEDTNSILTDNTNRAIQGNVAMQVTQPGGQVCNLGGFSKNILKKVTTRKQRWPLQLWQPSEKIELVSSSARVTSVKFHKRSLVWETRHIDRTRDTWIR